MEIPEERKDKLLPYAEKNFAYYEDMYKVIDFLNKNIKDNGLVLGLTKVREEMVIRIYRV